MKTRKEEDIFSFILAPLIDVMLFILIFFMVSYSVQSGYQNIILPASSTALKNQKRENITILELNDHKEYFLNGKIYSREELQKALMTLDGDKPLILRADKALSYQVVMQCIDLVKQSGIQKVYLATT